MLFYILYFIFYILCFIFYILYFILFHFILFYFILFYFILFYFILLNFILLNIFFSLNILFNFIFYFIFYLFFFIFYFILLYFYLISLNFVWIFSNSFSSCYNQNEFVFTQFWIISGTIQILGKDVGSVFLLTPPISVMLGPISKPPVVKKIMEKRAPKQMVWNMCPFSNTMHYLCCVCAHVHL